MVVIRPMTCQNTLNMLFYKWLATSLSRLLMLFVGVDLLFLLFPLLLNPRASNAPCMNTNCVLSLGTSPFHSHFNFHSFSSFPPIISFTHNVSPTFYLFTAPFLFPLFITQISIFTAKIKKFIKLEPESFLTEYLSRQAKGW